jgi:hypothetical protein
MLLSNVALLAVFYHILICCVHLQELLDREKVNATPPSEGKKQKKIDVVDEDVDIGDDMPANDFPPVEIEQDKDMSGTGGCVSSSSSGSSSSGSDSSSSGITSFL